jgi:dTDP-glucose 4,6-dehydratase
MNILFTGGEGFIGSNFIHLLLKKTGHRIINYDCLFYAANIKYLEALNELDRYAFVSGYFTD